MQRSTTKSSRQDPALNRVVTFTTFVLTHGVHGCPSFAACVRTDTSFTAASYLVPRCFASPEPMSAKEFHEALSLKHAVDRPPSTSLFTELLKLKSVTMITRAVSSLYPKFRMECMGLGPSLFGGFLLSCTREVSPDQSPTSTVAPKCERATSESIFTSCRRGRELWCVAGDKIDPPTFARKLPHLAITGDKDVIVCWHVAMDQRP